MTGTHFGKIEGMCVNFIWNWQSFGVNSMSQPSEVSLIFWYLKKKCFEVADESKNWECWTQFIYYF